MKIKDAKKVDKKETDLSAKTWGMVQDVASNEKKVNCNWVWCFHGWLHKNDLCFGCYFDGN